MNSIHPVFNDIEKCETRTSEFVIVKETFCDNFLFVHKIITILLFLLFIGVIVIIIITYF
jgi:uncharacterized membrane protein